MRYEQGEIANAFLFRLPYRHRVCGSGGLKTDAEKNHFLVRVCFCNFQAVQRRIYDSDVGSARFNDEQIDIRSGNSQHVTERTENHTWPLCNAMLFIDHLERRHADRAAWPIYQFNFLRQELIDAIFNDAVRLTTA